MGLAMTYSETTKQIKITAEPQFLPDESDPDNLIYAFSYTIRIENLGVATVQLLRRRWHISSGGVPFNEVEGEGVVGEQPVLKAGEGFVYTSWSVIKDPVGSMHGSYTFVSENGEKIEVAIPEFDLVFPRSVH